MTSKDQALDNLWLARAMYELGAVTFGDYTLGGSTVNSPVFINPKVLISNPAALRVAAKLMLQEVTLAQSLLRPKVQQYDYVAGVPVGGLLLATAYALESNTPLIYPRSKPEGTGARGIEGRFQPGSRALLIDDLVTGGSSLAETAMFMAEHGVAVHDAVVLVDREQGAAQRLKHAGINLISILKLDVMMNLYRSNGLLDEEQHESYLAYVRATRPAAPDHMLGYVETSIESGEDA
jgi:orotate phosphoribosyltransferase/uridine monophosphate synthetase